MRRRRREGEANDDTDAGRRHHLTLKRRHLTKASMEKANKDEEEEEEDEEEEGKWKRKRKMKCERGSQRGERRTS